MLCWLDGDECQFLDLRGLQHVFSQLVKLKLRVVLAGWLAGWPNLDRFI